MDWLAKLSQFLRPAEPAFDPQGVGYDYKAARGAGLGPTGTGENLGHWGSVAPVSPDTQRKYALPAESYMMLKGRGHPTWDKGVTGEAERGAKVIQLGDRFYSVPQDYAPASFEAHGLGIHAPKGQK